MTEKPRVSDSPMYRLLRDGRIQEFNQRKADGEEIVLSGCDFSNIDLRSMDCDGLDLSDAYFHGADMRALDLRTANLQGASIHASKISGTYFPDNLSAAELDLSLQHGTRLRTAI